MAHFEISRDSRTVRGTDWRALWRKLMFLPGLRRSRQRLSDLDPHILNDIGVSQRQAKFEANKPFWDVPDHWKN